MRTQVPDPAPGVEVVTIQTPCTSCRTPVKLNLNSRDVIHWKHGMHPRLAFPYLTMGQMSLLTDQLCPECYDEQTAEANTID